MNNAPKEADTTQLMPEFDFWPMNEKQQNRATLIRFAINNAAKVITTFIPKHNAEYRKRVMEKLEEACLLAIKGVAKPEKLEKGEN